MSKNEFLDQLSILLSDVSPEEKEEVLAYYREYIEDAGLENEEAILEELGTPETVAAEIKSGMLNKNNQDINYSSNTVKQEVPLGLVCEKLCAISCARICATASKDAFWLIPPIPALALS